MPLATAREAILIVLGNARAKAEFSHEDIATQVLDLMHQLGIDTRNTDERRREALPPAKPEWVEQLTYRIEHREPGECVLEVLSREHEVSPAKAAFAIYRGKYPDKRLLLLEGGGRVIASTDDRDGE